MKFFKLGDDKRFVFSVFFSLVVTLTAVVWTYRIGQSSNNYAHRLGHLEDGLADLKKYLATREARK